MRRILAPLILVTLLLGAASAASTEVPTAEARRLALENDQLARQLALAESDAFYLVLDPHAQRLKLMLRGTVLQDFPLSHVSVGSRRVAFAARKPPEQWAWRVFEGGELDPPREFERFELTVKPGMSEDEVPQAPLPPTPEERFPALDRYRIHYQDGLALEVRIEGASVEKSGFWQGLGTALHARLDDLAIAVGLREERDVLRIRVDLARDDAASLYRGLPPDTRFLVLAAPPTP